MFHHELNFLGCPTCRRGLRVLDAHTGLICPRCRLVYPVFDEVPLLAADAGVPLFRWKSGFRGETGGLLTGHQPKRML